MSELSIATLQQELQQLTVDYPKHYEREQAKSSILNDIAILHWEAGDKKEAISYWEQSLEVFPYLHERNMDVAFKMLQEKEWFQANRFLMQYIHSWIHLPGQGEKLVRTRTLRVERRLAIAEQNGTVEDVLIENRLVQPMWYSREYYDLPLTKLLAEIVEKDNITDYPNLIGGYYYLFRQTLEFFDIDPKGLGFSKDHLPTLEAFANQYQNNSLLWAVVGNTYFLDVKDHQKAFLAYSKAIENAEVSTFVDPERFLRAAMGSRNSFDKALLQLKEKTPHLSADCCYELRGDLSTIREEQVDSGKAWSDLYWELELFFSRTAWEKLRKYVIEGDTFDPSTNQPHTFAMACNNYACSLEEHHYRKIKVIDQALTEKVIDRELTQKLIALRQKGFSISPFWENLRPQIEDYIDLDQYGECLQLRPMVEEFVEHIKDPYQENEAYQNFMLAAYRHSAPLAEASAIYQKAKELFMKNRGKDPEEPEITDAVFVNTLKNYCAILILHKDYASIEKEFLWAEENGIPELDEDEIGDLLYYFATASHLLVKDQQALAAYNRAIPYFAKPSADKEILATMHQAIAMIENRIYKSGWQKLRYGFLPRFINVFSSYFPKRRNEYNVAMMVVGAVLLYYASTGKMMTVGYVGGVLLLASGVLNLLKKK